MLKMKIFWLIFRGKFEQKTQKSIFLKNQWRQKNIKKAMVVKNIIAEDMPFTKSIFEQFWRSYCKKTIFVVFHFLKFLPIYNNGFPSKGGRPVPDIVQQYQSVGLYLSADTWNSLRGYELKKNTLKMCSPPPRRLLKSSCRSFSVALPLNFHLLRSFVPYSFSFKDLLV